MDDCSLSLGEQPPDIPEPDASADTTPVVIPVATPALVDTPRPTWRLVLHLAVPVLAQQVLVLFVGLSDAYLAGNYRPPDLRDLAAYQSAQTTANYLAWFLSSYTVLVTVGSTALVARATGAKDQVTAIHMTNQSLLLALGLGVVGLIAGLTLGETLVHWLQLRGAAARFAVDYLHPQFLLLPFQVLELAGIACLVGAGDTRTGLWVMMGVALVNLPLAWALCLGLGPFPEMGFVGISMGTALSHLLGGIVVLVVLARGQQGLQLRLWQFWPDPAALRRLLRVSIPAGVDSLSVVAGQLWFLAIVNTLGDVAASAHGIALRWEALGFLSGAAFGTAAMTLVGQHLGAGQPERAAHSGWVAFGLACAVMCVMGAIFFTLAWPMFLLFCPNAEQADIMATGVPVLRLVAFAMPALASAIVFTSALRGAGDTAVPVLFTWIGFLLVRIPLAYVLTLREIDLGWLGTWPGADLGLFGAWLAMFADLVVRGVFFALRFASGAWQKIKV